MIAYHSLYWSLKTAFQPSGTFGGGGPVGGAYDDIRGGIAVCLDVEGQQKEERIRMRR